jgi:hypothetical protein
MEGQEKKAEDTRWETSSHRITLQRALKRRTVNKITDDGLPLLTSCIPLQIVSFKNVVQTYYLQSNLITSHCNVIGIIIYPCRIQSRALRKSIVTQT